MQQTLKAPSVYTVKAVNGWFQVLQDDEYLVHTFRLKQMADNYTAWCNKQAQEQHGRAPQS